MLSESDYFYPSAFLPHFVRKAIKSGFLEALPSKMPLDVIMLSIEIPVSSCLTDIYLKNDDVKGNEVYELITFFTELVEVLHKRKADIYLFVDSTIKCFWIVGDHTFRETTCFALEFAFYVKEILCPKYSSEIWKIQSSSVIVSGLITIIFIGDLKKRVMWCVTGNPVEELQTGIRIADVNKIIVTNSVWETIKTFKSSYSFNRHEDFFEVDKISNAYISNMSEIVSQKTSFFSFFAMGKKVTPIDFSNMFINPIAKSGVDEIQELRYWNETFRPSVMKCITPLLSKVDTMQQLEILSSMTVLVVCTIFIQKDNFQLSKNLSEILKVISDINLQYGGLVNFIEYQKGILIGISFGNAGFRNSDDCERALRWSRDINIILHDLEYNAVIRLTCGMCYSGAVGPIGRMYFCIIGKPLSQAIRLVHMFTNDKLICESSVALKSHREFGLSAFRLIHSNTRGKHDIPVCFAINFSRSPAQPAIKCISREAEREAVLNALEKLQNPNEPLENKVPLIIIKGPLGSGKTNFAKHIHEEISSRGTVISCFVGESTHEEKLEKSWHILKQVLSQRNITTDKKIINILGDDVERYPLYLLNRHFNTKFKRNREYVVPKFDLIKRMLIYLLKASVKGKPIFIVLDSGELTSVYTAQLLSELLHSRTIIVLITINEPINVELPEYIKALIGNSYETITFEPFEKSTTLILACHFLNVISIQKDFFSFLWKHCLGNPLRLQELLLLPEIQSHLSLLEYNSISTAEMENSFYRLTEYDLNKTAVGTNCTKVCALFDIKSLNTIHVPVHTGDILEEYVGGFTIEEQMLIKKCACLGSQFELYILEAVCPEYSFTSLLENLSKIIRKNLFMISCKHYKMEDYSFRQCMQSAVLEEFCSHALQFKIAASQESVMKFMQKGLIDKVHLHFVKQLADTEITCDSCRLAVGMEILPKNKLFLYDMYIPRFQICHCYCTDFKILIFRRMDYHMEKGNVPIEQRIVSLFLALEIAICMENEAEINEIFEKIDFCVNAYESEYFLPQLIKVALFRSRAETYKFFGEMEKSKKNINQAFHAIGKDFPTYYLRHNLKFATPFEIEELKCLFIGCKILLQESEYEKAYTIASRLFHSLSHEQENSISCSYTIEFPCLHDILTKECILMSSVSKEIKRKSKQEVITYMQNIVEKCCLHLSEGNRTNVHHLSNIIKTLLLTTFVLFERNELVFAETIGTRVLNICDITTNVKQLNKIYPLLCLIFYYSNVNEKCYEILSHFATSKAQLHDPTAEAIYYALIIKLSTLMKHKTLKNDKAKMCTNFAILKCHDMFLQCSDEKKYWVTTMMSVWSLQQNLCDTFVNWYKQAIYLRENIQMTNYWSLEGELRMSIIEIMKIKIKALTKKKVEITAEINAVRKTVNEIEELAKKYAIVLLLEIDKTRNYIQTIYTKLYPH